MISAKLAKINNCFLKGFSSRLVGSRGKRPASLSGSSSGVAEETIGRRRECRGGLVVAIADGAPHIRSIIDSANQALVAERPVVLPHI